MTRQELIDALHEGCPIHNGNTSEHWIKHRRLSFAMWWYGNSTEADNDHPRWPSASYIASNLNNNPPYLTDIGAAWSLIPPYLVLNILAPASLHPTVGTVWQDPIVQATTHAGVFVSEVKAPTLSLGLCITAIKARMYKSQGLI
jgi:hypothetical protein